MDIVSTRCLEAGAGMTHSELGNGTARLSAFRLFEEDPIFFENGFELRWRNGDMTHMAPGPEYGHKCVDTDMPGVNGSSVIGHPGRARVTSSIWAYEWSDDDAAGPSTAEDPSAVLDFAKALHLLVSFVRAGELDQGVEDRGVEMLADGDAPLARLMHAVDLANVQGDFEARTSLLAHAARRIQRA